MALCWAGAFRQSFVWNVPCAAFDAIKATPQPGSLARWLHYRKVGTPSAVMQLFVKFAQAFKMVSRAQNLNPSSVSRNFW